ncbi:immunity-related GTPase family Q protein [Manis javanica]|uniref:immunity-related GTPase family Q protein n=1 Tax=Manis javanica TaxID=9974 RepID=UPI001879AA07|nr:immunity-related GTPase family Q protein [Manis javanica]XP_036868318.1 immunity-related GTPase family Q protein [Manis javanica]XP_036868319.1 immunity-related GTPase family Q protein [Manis javanica]XP_036868320.1 immunity-related GTPase family Q protein [Manis javanica]XP_036868323.1 immunity-related GTPase family Q protein [Manis javanica]XP_036868324.1 immunity-related GTPase family Q protein [Manis javanica]
MPPPRGDVTALFLGPPGSGKSALIAALCDKDLETVEIPERRTDSGIPSLRAAGPGLFLGELSCPPAEPGPWAAEANLLVVVLPGPEGNAEPLAPALGEAARAALARGTPLLAVRNLRPGDSQNEEQARDQTEALLNSAGLGATSLFVLQADCSNSDSCEELERLRVALRSQAESLQRLLPPAQDGFEVLGAAELEAVREAFETGGLEAALSWVRAGLERLGSARLDLAVAGTADVGLVMDTLLGLDAGAEPASAPAGPTPYPAPERPNVVLWAVPLGCVGTAATSHPTHYDALILVTPGAPTEKDWAQVRPLVQPDAPLVCVRTDGEGKDPEPLEEEEKAEKPSGECLKNAGGGGLENARREGSEKCGPGAQKAGSGSLRQVGVGVKKPGSGDSESAVALSPEDESWEVLEEAPPPVFPLRPGGLPGLCEWLRRALPAAQAGALLLALPPSSPYAARTKAAALRAGAWRPALLASLAAAAAPVPGLGWACDVALLRGQLAEWRRALGLEPAALARRERALGLAPGELSGRTRFPGPVTRAEVEARLGSWAGEGTAGGAALGALSFLWPAGGAAATGGLGYRAAHGVLLQALEEMCADAEAVLAPHLPAQ